MATLQEDGETLVVSKRRGAKVGLCACVRVAMRSVRCCCMDCFKHSRLHAAFRCLTPVAVRMWPSMHLGAPLVLHASNYCM